MPSKIELNAAIERLLSGDKFDLEAASMVIEFCKDKRMCNKITLEHLGSKEDDSSVQGYVSGVGNVDYKEQNSQRSNKITIGIYEERVGAYKLERHKDDFIQIRHYWKSDLDTGGDMYGDREIHYLGFNKKTLEPAYLAVREESKGIPIFLLPMYGRILVVRVACVFGKYIFCKKKRKRKYIGIKVRIGP